MKDQPAPWIDEKLESLQEAQEVMEE